MSEIIFRNARMVLPDAVKDGDLVVRDGTIVEFADAGHGMDGIDLEGDWLLPGLIELHTDHLESHYAPRPRVRWNPEVAVLAHDAQIAAAGITTVCDALRVGLDEDISLTTADMCTLADAIGEGAKRDRLRAEHFIHLRCEVSSADVMESFARFADDDRVRIASLMDHSPGQRQFTTIESYRIYYQGKTGMSDEVFAAFVDRRQAEAGLWSDRHRQAISTVCRERGIMLASHDDATESHIAEALRDGVVLAEFPTTMAAARASHRAGLKILMGAPNIVRGGSHSGNMAAADLVADGLLDILSSDYVPFSLLQATFNLGKDDEAGLSLPQAVKLVSANPAAAAGFDDRGEIAPGKRADLVQVHLDNGVPVVRSVWRQARRVV